MYPNDPQPLPTPPPVDYLNQIAPQGPKKAPFSFGLKQVAIIAAIVVVFVIILSVIVTNLAGGKKGPIERLSVELTATETIVTDAQKNLKSSKMKALNSSLTIFLANTNRDVAKQLVTAGINAKSIKSSDILNSPTAVKNGTSPTQISARLEDARLNAVFDRTYAREMAYQLSTLLNLMTEIYNSTNSTSLKTLLEKTYDNLEPTQEAFANFSSAE